MIWHTFYLWFWYITGAVIYAAKRAYYSIKPPSPVAHSIGEYLHLSVAGMPLIFRFAVESAIYWICFTPQVLAAGLHFLGWEKFAGTVEVITQFAPCAFAFGLVADFGADWFIATKLSKISFLNIKDWWPQMPPPLPQEAIVKAAIVETKVTELKERTIVVPNPNPKNGAEP